MRLATRTALAAFVTALFAAAVSGVAVQVRFARVLEERTDAQLEQRRTTAPILVAVAARLETSELNGIVEGARVTVDGRTIALGQLPDEALPAPGADGFATATADGERWRLLSFDVRDVPAIGDVATVQLVAPLGDVDERTKELRRQLIVVGLAIAAVAGGLGYLLARRAARPLARLRANAEAIDHADPTTWSLGERSGAADVDDVAAALDASLARLAEETDRRDAALQSARAFASSATHELRTPLQSALTNLDIASSPAAGADDVDEAIRRAREQIQRGAQGLAAVRALANAEFADPAWFRPTALPEVVDRAIVGETRSLVDPPQLDVVVADDAEAPITLWPDGAELAIANLIRNALRHGGGDSGGRIVVTVDRAAVAVDDSGPGIAADDRQRVLGRFERGADTGRGGAGLGLAIVTQVALAHHGGVTIEQSPLGGARVVVTFAAPVRHL